VNITWFHKSVINAVLTSITEKICDSVFASFSITIMVDIYGGEKLSLIILLLIPEYSTVSFSGIYSGFADLLLQQVLHTLSLAMSKNFH
jgi:hypothetical protein